MGAIYRSDNYLIVENAGKMYEYALINTGYTRNDEGGIDKFEIVESAVSARLSGRSQILVSEIDLGEWLDAPAGDPFTVETLTTFLRQNTANFNQGGATKFSELTDVPPYLGNALKGLRINAAEDGLEAYVPTDLNEWLFPGAAFVDPLNGNNSTAKVGDGNLPFLTIKDAQDASNLVVGLPGNYSGTNTLKDGVKYHFFDGAIFGLGASFSDGGNPINIKITGDLTLNNNSTGFSFIAIGSQAEIEVKEFDDVRTVAWVFNASNIYIKCKSILANCFNGGAYACTVRTGGKLVIDVQFKAYFQHWAVAGVGAVGQITEFVLNCPDIRTIENYTTNYGNQGKALINDPGFYGDVIYTINGNYKQEFPIQTSAFGVLESIILYSSISPSEPGSTFNFNGNFDSGVFFGCLIYYQVSNGEINFNNGTLKSGSNALSVFHSNTNVISNVKVNSNNFKFEGQLFNQIGNGKNFYFQNTTFKVNDPTATAIFSYNPANLGGGTPSLKLVNCAAELANVGGEFLADPGGAVTFGAVNTLSNKALGAGVVDIWAGYSEIPSFNLP